MTWLLMMSHRLILAPTAHIAGWKLVLWASPFDWQHWIYCISSWWGEDLGDSALLMFLGGGVVQTLLSIGKYFLISNTNCSCTLLDPPPFFFFLFLGTNAGHSPLKIPGFAPAGSKSCHTAQTQLQVDRAEQNYCQLTWLSSRHRVSRVRRCEGYSVSQTRRSSVQSTERWAPLPRQLLRERERDQNSKLQLQLQSQTMNLAVSNSPSCH